MLRPRLLAPAIPVAPATAILAALVVLSWTTVAVACPACAGNGMPVRTVNAYLAMTALLSLAPIGFVCLFVWLLRPPKPKRPSAPDDPPREG